MTGRGARARPRKRLPAEERRELILRAAKARFAQHGYASTSIDDIAAAAGVTKPVVYDHFASKRSLCFALMRRLRDELLDAATASLSAATTPRERFHTAILTFFEQVRRDPAIVQLLFVQSRTEPELSSEWERLQAEAVANLKPLVQALAPALRPWQLEVVVRFLHHGVNASAEAWPKQASAEDMTDLIVALMWQGLEAFEERSAPG
jgi:AcrR family transcriptional regulator